MSTRPTGYGLTVNCAARPPTADYRCRCGFDDAAQGRSAVAKFAATVDAEHRPKCPLKPVKETRP